MYGHADEGLHLYFERTMRYQIFHSHYMYVCVCLSSWIWKASVIIQKVFYFLRIAYARISERVSSRKGTPKVRQHPSSPLARFMLVLQINMAQTVQRKTIVIKLTQFFVLSFFYKTLFIPSSNIYLFINFFFLKPK